MLIEDIKKVNPSKLDESAKKVYEKLKEKSNNFDPEYLIVYQNLEDAVKEFVDVVKEKYPDAIRIVRERKKKEVPPTPDTDDKEVIEAMRDYNLSQEKAERLIKLRKEASETRKESLDKMLDTLRKSEFYGESGTSKRAIDKNRSRDLGKDTNRGSITLKDELRMTGRPYKRISKNGKVYYEYRLNRRDIDHKVRLAKGGITEHGLRVGDTIIEDFGDDEIGVRSINRDWHRINLEKGQRFAKGGGVEIPNADKMFHLPYELAVYVPSTQDVDKNITASQLRARVKLVEKYLAETFGGFTSSEKVGGYLSSKSSVVTERVVPVTAFATMDAFRKNKSKLVNKMSVWAKEWGQEAIGFEFEGDLYYVPQKFKKGGTLTATYIPKRDIKMLTTVWGNNIKGKDLIDGAYTKRKNIKTAPKMARTMFEEETFEFAKGGKVGQTLEFEYMGDPMTGHVIEVLGSGDYVVRSGTRTILVDDMNVTKYGEMSKNRFGFYKKGGKTKKPMVVRYYFEDEEFEYKNGGHIEEEIDLFEDYENIPDNVQAILEKNEDAFETGDYKGLEKALKEMNKIGYTFDYYLDGQAYNLRPIGSKGKHE
jgi:hypothetical protein